MFSVLIVQRLCAHMFMYIFLSGVNQSFCVCVCSVYILFPFLLLFGVRGCDAGVGLVSLLFLLYLVYFTGNKHQTCLNIPALPLSKPGQELVNEKGIIIGRLSIFSTVRQFQIQYFQSNVRSSLRAA